MKTTFIFFTVLFVNNISFPQDIHNEELLFTNYSTNIVSITVFPISMIFNANDEYNLVAKKRSNPSNP